MKRLFERALRDLTNCVTSPLSHVLAAATTLGIIALLAGCSTTGEQEPDLPGRGNDSAAGTSTPASGLEGRTLVYQQTVDGTVTEPEIRVSTAGDNVAAWKADDDFIIVTTNRVYGINPDGEIINRTLTPTESAELRAFAVGQFYSSSPEENLIRNLTVGVDPAPAPDRIVAGVESACVTGRLGLTADEVAGTFCTAKSGGFLTFADNAGSGYELLSVNLLDPDVFDLSSYPDAPERWFVSFDGYGPIAVGLTVEELGQETSSEVQLDPGEVCSYVDIPSPTPDLDPAVVVFHNEVGTVDGVTLPSGTKASTEQSIGIGSSLADVLATYDLTRSSLVQGAFGEWFLLVQGPDPAAVIGFGFGFDEPAESADVDNIRIGSADFAQGIDGCPE